MKFSNLSITFTMSSQGRSLSCVPHSDNTEESFVTYVQIVWQPHPSKAMASLLLLAH